MYVYILTYIMRRIVKSVTSYIYMLHEQILLIGRVKYFYESCVLSTVLLW
jgi:hypothetical protein